ncbi:MAG: HEAT repeat domain-containing protein, partial [Pseudanabaena sp.]
ALGGICSDKVVEPLIQALKDSDNDVRWRAAEALVKIAGSIRNLPTLTQQLPHLLTLIPTEASQQALSVITAIQARCKYYNYDIAQTPLQEENNNDKVLSNPQGNIIHMTEIKNDFSSANFGGANIANLGGTVNAQKIVQKTEVPKQNLAEATKEVQDLLNQLAKTNPSETTIADTIQQEIKRNPTLKARLVNALKTGGIEALKVIFNNPFVSIPVETVKGFLEAEE